MSDIRWAKKINELSRRLVMALERGDFKESQKLRKRIKNLTRLIREEITSGEAKREHAEHDHKKLHHARRGYSGTVRFPNVKMPRLKI